MVKHIVSAFLLIVVCFLCVGATLRPYYTYTMYTGEDITVGWDASEGATTYDIRLHSFERNVTFLEYTGLTTTTAVLPVTKSGHYILQVRACNTECSEWTDSTTGGSVVEGTDRIPQGWWIYAHIAPVTQPEIEQ